MNQSLSAPHIYRRRPTPWPIRLFMVIAVLFGIWVDVNDADSSNNTSTTAHRTQLPAQHHTGDHTVADDIIRTLASRR